MAGFENEWPVSKVVDFEQAATVKEAHAGTTVSNATHRFGRKIKLASTTAIKHQLRKLMFLPADRSIQEFTR
ncbi:MAG: hypothetical protein WBD95_20180 [Xanthobacteraceae bacterium]